MTCNRYAPLENRDENFNSSSGDNLLQSEINAATQDQINNNGRRQEKKKALMISDSMVKGIKRWKISKKMEFTNASVKCFPGVNTSDMKHYIKPPIRKSPNEVVIIQTGTNNLSSGSTPTEIATNIIDLAVDVKKSLNQSCDVMISSIIPRGDQLQQKAFNINKQLKELCASKNIRYIEHGNIHPRNRLNRFKLNFNFHGNFSFLSGICKYLECLQVYDCCNEKEGNVNVNNSNEKSDYCNRKDIESSSNNLTNYDASNKNDIENINSKNSKFCSENDITNKADINKVMDENPCKIH